MFDSKIKLTAQLFYSNELHLSLSLTHSLTRSLTHSLNLLKLELDFFYTPTKNFEPVNNI